MTARGARDRLPTPNASDGKVTEHTDWRIALALYGVLTVFVVGSFAAIAQVGARATAVSHSPEGKPGP